MKTSKILITTDFSNSSLAALEFISKADEYLSSEITILHVNESLDFFITQSNEYGIPLDYNSFEESNRNHNLKLLNELKNTYFNNHHCLTDILNTNSDISEDVCQYAKQNKFDLIAISTRGHTKLGALLLGSTTQRILLLTEIPVLVIPSNKEE